MQMVEANDCVKWLIKPGERMVCLFITDMGQIEEHLYNCPKSISLDHAAFALEQGFACAHYDEDGGPQLRLRCDPCAGAEAGNATVVLIPEGDFRKDMPGREAMAKSLRTLGRVDLSIGC